MYILLKNVLTIGFTIARTKSAISGWRNVAQSLPAERVMRIAPHRLGGVGASGRCGPVMSVLITAGVGVVDVLPHGGRPFY